MTPKNDNDGEQLPKEETKAEIHEEMKEAPV